MRVGGAVLKREENERVTRTGPGTPLGRLMRAYWQPAALVSEMPADRPVKPVRLLGEDLVLFRTDDGGWALVGRFCAHRGVDLAYARHEDGGLRCLYHGWLYGPDGRCREQPAEPPHSRFAEKVRIPSYPCVERNGIVFAYLGEGDPPPFPAYDCFGAPDEYTFAFKGCGTATGSKGWRAASTPATSRSCTGSSTRTRATRTGSSSARSWRAPGRSCPSWSATRTGRTSRWRPRRTGCGCTRCGG
ncbi:hypothetical protein Prum_077880 [Phytohabitans rumicis]|uniref:Rieske domain-containing protein n=1 Tax=Phytohabitans rumicis TaxID=1076125 RepID=A0A6V8LIZ7_9ACTN|nr:hypothetical protein Prum_077880 [Phytohabitans rumicis]